MFCMKHMSKVKTNMCFTITIGAIVSLLIISCANVDDSQKKDFGSLAEDSIMESNYINAIDNYNRVTNLLSIDCYNALIASIKIKDWDGANKWTKELILRGVGKSFFNQKIFNDYRSSHDWKKLETRFSEYRSAFQETYNESIDSKIKQLIEIDQAQYCGLKTGDVSLDSAFNLTLSMDENIIGLFNEPKLLTEKSIGANIKNDTILLPFPKYYVLLRHSFQSNSSFFEYFKENYDVGLYMKQEVFNNLENTPFKDNVVYKIDDEFYEKLNPKTDSIGYSKYLKRIEFNECFPNNFKIYAPYTTLNFKNEQSKNNFLSSTEPLKFSCNR